MIQVFADDAYVWNDSLERWVFQNDVRVYDSRLEAYDLLGLTITTGLNVGGTAEIVMPQGHPAFNSFQPFKTLVRVYRDGELRFRGRVLYPEDNFLGQRTITCEGEMCMLRDSIYRPYKKVGAVPSSFFNTMVNAHNSQVETIKRFTVGTISNKFKDSKNEIEMENENAESVLDAISRLVEQVGGYITFTSAADGTRAINWLESLDNKSGQTIEFGENLLDFSRTGANTTGLATALIPYGAKKSDKTRTTIAGVNDQFPGKDYITDPDAVQARGTIMASVTWDDITSENKLLEKAKAYLNDRKMFITSLTVTALDLSYMDKSIDSFTVGDMIRVVSAPHGINEDFQLNQMTEDLLNPASSKITLGKDIPSLTGADVTSAKQGQNLVSSVQKEVNGINLEPYATTEQVNGQLSSYAQRATSTAMPRPAT